MEEGERRGRKGGREEKWEEWWVEGRKREIGKIEMKRGKEREEE